jgi:predicted molibdopterin-dependent oxidoreductase YjgC
MAELVWISIDESPVEVEPGTTVAAAILQSDTTGFRRSVTGEWRGPVCGMGICFECRVTINGQPHRRSCQAYCESGMVVRTK